MIVVMNIAPCDSHQVGILSTGEAAPAVSTPERAPTETSAALTVLLGVNGVGELLDRLVHGHLHKPLPTNPPSRVFFTP